MKWRDLSKPMVMQLGYIMDTEGNILVCRKHKLKFVVLGYHVDDLLSNSSRKKSICSVLATFL